jgi:hypothetical protein
MTSNLKQSKTTKSNNPILPPIQNKPSSTPPVILPPITEQQFPISTDLPLSNSPNIEVIPNLDFTHDETGENIKVCLRIRPLNVSEKGRNDTKSLTIMNDTQVLFTSKQLRRNYTFNLVFDETSSQEDIFYHCSINKLIDSAMDGYSVTIFAYGQTGSGKTYTIMGRDDSINENILSNDRYSGIIAKSVKYIWNTVGNREEKFYIKVSFLEIYNEQINDLLNPGNTALQIRWDQKQGFFVEGLLVIECKKPEDIVEVLLQGTKNRKKGSHELNKDSSRSHSILTLYIITDYTTNGEHYKKYGKISFVDLAGSERLKETKSSGGMLKETGNINKSLFVLGKVISTLADKKNVNQHVSYRDSKLTMLLMDSIGGTAKTLMIACVSPSNIYSDETMSTLNYASRTMCIKNKPLVQMEGQSRGMISLKKENDYYRRENDFYKNQLLKLVGTIPDISKGGFTDEEIDAFKNNSGTAKIEMLETEIKSLENELEVIRRAKEKQERQNINLSNENTILNVRLNNLENVYIGCDIVRNKDGSVSNNVGSDYTMQAIMLENKELKKTVDKLELDKIELKDIYMRKDKPGLQMRGDRVGFENMREQNAKLAAKLERLIKRERDLRITLNQLARDNNNGNY